MIALPQASISPPLRSRDLGGRSVSVGVWLFIVAMLVGLMVVVGGATRLTGSGLSITEWKPLTGALPPLGDAAWFDIFAKYRATSQYRLINQGITLDEFKILFWWEWGHRLLGRAVGLVFAAPFVVFLLTRRIPARLVARCFGLLALGGLQGLVGWWMVKSGLEGRASVAPERLAVHLGLALFLLAALVWTGLEAWAGPPPSRGRTRQASGVLTAVFTAGVYFQCLLGALVAGNGAGRVDTDWPLMAGRWFPADYWHDGLWATLAHSRPAVQFNHRLLAYGLLLAGLTLVMVRSAAGAASPTLQRLTVVCAFLLLVQAGLGVGALVFGDPLGLALAHQANAALLLGATVAMAWCGRRG